jgi:predicted protein tyrosine phosphatase
MTDSTTSFRFSSQQPVDRSVNPTKRRNRKGLSLAVASTRPSPNIDLHNDITAAPANNTMPQQQKKLITSSMPTTDNDRADKPYKQGPICILPYLYLGDENNANDMKRLEYLNIGYILNVAKEVTHPSEHEFSVGDLSDDDGGATSPSLSISSSASSASSINTLSSSFLFGFNDLENEVTDRRNSFRQDSPMSSPKEQMDDLGKHSPFSPRGVKPTPPGLRVLRFRPSASNFSFASAFKASITVHSRHDFISNRQQHSNMKRCRKLSHRISSSGRRKRHGSQVAQSEDGTQLQQIKYKKFAWTHNHENLATELGPALDIIDRARAAKTPILVHCQCGVARSASLVIAYVMHTFKISLNQAYDFVKTKSNSISPNMYLMFQLRDFETHQGLGLSTTTTRPPPLRKCSSMQFNMTDYVQSTTTTTTKDHHLIQTLVKLEPSAADSLLLSRRSLDDSFHQSYSFRSESPFTNDLRMYL